MKTYLIITILFLSLNMVSAYPQTSEISLIKPLFFNAPIEKFDSVNVLNFFKEDSSFNYVHKPGISVQDYTGVSNSYSEEFYFKKHPLLSGFDTGRITLWYSDRYVTYTLRTVGLYLSFTDEDSCKAAYNKILDMVKNRSENLRETRWEISDFAHFKHIFLNVFAQIWNNRETRSIQITGKP